jgi:hypothetical protein
MGEWKQSLDKVFMGKVKRERERGGKQKKEKNEMS